MPPSAVSSLRNGHDIQSVEKISYLLDRDLHNAPPFASHAKGNYIFLDNGEKIMDSSGGAAVSSGGHGLQVALDAFCKQAVKVDYCHSGLVSNKACHDLADFLCKSTNGRLAKAYFSCSGSEATEAALKMAIQYHHDIGHPERKHFIARQTSYHGATIGALGLSDHKERRRIFEGVLSENVSWVSACNTYRDRNGLSDADYVAGKANELRAKFLELADQQGANTVAAFICEPVSGAALGCVPFVPGYLAAMKAVCIEYGALFILDEIMSGMGRCGELHAWQLDHSEEEGHDCSPDIQMIGKALGGGIVPISGIIINQKVVKAIKNGGTGGFSHGQTFQNHPPSAAAALAMQQYIEEGNWIKNGRIQGEYMASLLHQKLDSHPHVGDIRGLGTFWGIELVQDKETKEPFDRNLKIAEGLQKMAFGKYNMAIYCGQGTKDGISGDHVMLCPAFNITREEVEFIANTMAQVIQNFFESPQFS